jgi:hypothetical protein
MEDEAAVELGSVEGVLMMRGLVLVEGRVRVWEELAVGAEAEGVDGTPAREA